MQEGGDKTLPSFPFFYNIQNPIRLNDKTYTYYTKTQPFIIYKNLPIKINLNCLSVCTKEPPTFNLDRRTNMANIKIAGVMIDFGFLNTHTVTTHSLLLEVAHQYVNANHGMINKDILVDCVGTEWFARDAGKLLSENNPRLANQIMELFTFKSFGSAVAEQLK